MKKKYLTLPVILVLIVGFGLSILSIPKIIPNTMEVEQQYREADLVWSDNFDDGNMDGWYTNELSGLTPNYTVSGGVVYSHGVDVLQVASRESSVVYGTWSFDVYINRLAGIEIIETAEAGTNYTQDGYEVVFAPDEFNGIGPYSIQLHELYATSATTWGYHRLDYKIIDPDGWHHFDITRDTSGYFCVYLNGTVVMEAIDNTVTTSNAFAFCFVGAFDNVVVSDHLTIDEVAPYFLQEPTDQVITFGDDFSYKLNATDSSGPPTWEVNDTARFDVSGDGLVTNLVDLEVGVYGLKVTASDGGVYDRSVTFSVTVEAAETPFDPTLFVVAGGVAAVVVIVVLVLFLKKRT